MFFFLIQMFHSEPPPRKQNYFLFKVNTAILVTVLMASLAAKSELAVSGGSQEQHHLDNLKWRNLRRGLGVKQTCLCQG